MSFDRAARGEKPDRAQLRPGYPIDLNEIMQLCTPEMVCCYESMQAAERRMFLFGLENPAKFINPKTSLATALKAVQKNRGETEAIKCAEPCPFAPTAWSLLAHPASGFTVLQFHQTRYGA